MSYLKSLPINDSPDIFGLHSNANITFLQMETNNLFQTLLSLQPRVSSEGGLSGRNRDSIVEDTASNILKRVPAAIGYEVICDSCQTGIYCLFLRLDRTHHTIRCQQC
jgi:dynein heavy chain, axonemal